jgi:hypothetical protein
MGAGLVVRGACWGAAEDGSGVGVAGAGAACAGEEDEDAGVAAEGAPEVWVPEDGALAPGVDAAGGALAPAGVACACARAAKTKATARQTAPN